MERVPPSSWEPGSSCGSALLCLPELLLELSWAQAQSPPGTHLTNELCLPAQATCCLLLGSYDPVAGAASTPHVPAQRWGGGLPWKAGRSPSQQSTWLPRQSFMLSCTSPHFWNRPPCLPHLLQLQQDRNLDSIATWLIQVMFAFLKSNHNDAFFFNWGYLLTYDPHSSIYLVACMLFQ